MGKQVDNERENERAIDAGFGALTKAVQPKLMFNGLKKAFNGPAF